ncbi:hypothetical protein [Pseudomonas chlororaphis]|uniref:hypothetical protein n=1 Tax=Pseudomonas chlororaphis TaxID=587753 RepID=UPI0013DDBAD6|nr:hypothetical protein [Pseudomonas chlororaphis]
MEEFYKSPHGSHVTYRDHRTNVVRLRAEVERLTQLAADRKNQQTELCTEITQLTEELDALKAAQSLAEQRGFIRGINAEAAARRENDAAQSQGVQVNQVRSHGSDCWEDISGESLELVREQPEEYEVRTLYRHPPAPRGEPDAWLAEATNSAGVVYRKVTSPAEITMRDVRFAWGEGVLKRYTICIRKLYTSPPAPVALHVPDECPHMIVFDDADRQQLMFAGAGARDSALKAWEQISGSWNAHLFVRAERNSRDDRYPSAKVAPVEVVLPERLPGDDGVCTESHYAKGWNDGLDEVARRLNSL